MRKLSRFLVTLISAAALTVTSMSFAFAEELSDPVGDPATNQSQEGTAGTADVIIPSDSLQQAGLMAAPVLKGPTLRAAGANEFVYTPVNGSSQQFTKYLTMDEEANVPNTTFEFTIEAGAAIAATANTLAVYPGPINPTLIPSATTNSDSTSKLRAVFTVGQQTWNNTETDPDYMYIDGTGTLPAGKKFAKSNFTIDFSGISFAEPGVYRYIIKEVSANEHVTTLGKQAIVNDGNDTRTLDVYVIDNNGTLQVAQYALHTGNAAPRILATAGSGDVSQPGGKLSDKVAGYGNDYVTVNLTVKKEVAGNQASKDKYFKFHVAISGAVPGTKYNVQLNKEDVAKAVATPTKTEATNAEYTNMSNPTELTVGADGKVETDLYLQHGQYIRIDGIAKGTTYVVTETPEDYKSDALQGAANNGTTDTEDLLSGFLNTRDGNIPTGVILEFGPYVIGAVVLLFALIYVLTGKKRRAA